ncbi:MAG: T9SS type A sorting domain-containing protein [Bacteroidales bacterium]
MNSLIYSFVAFFIFFGLTAKAQNIQNSGFENWANVQYFEDPDGFTTTNFVSYFADGTANATKTSDAYSGSYALTLETIDTDEGPIAGAAFIGLLGNGAIIGGIPFTERPDSLTGYVKYNVAGIDTAYVAVLFKKFGAPLGICFVQLTGNQNDYQFISQPINWLIPIISPDTLAIGIISSTLFGIPVPGSTITVDNLQFVGANTPFPNGDFENWTEFASEEAVEWISSNIFTLPESDISMTKTTDSHEGNYAIRLENQPTIWDDTLSFITNGTIDENGPTGGMPVDDVPNILSGYYKYLPVGPDTALAGMVLYHYNEITGNTEILDSSFIKLPPVNQYTYFEVPVDYYSLPEPDTINIAFSAGNLEDSSYVGLGSVLYIDALEITYKPHIVSVNDKLENTKPAVYPNPVNDRLFFEIANLIHQPIEVLIFNSNGKLITSKETSYASKLSIDVKKINSGLYFYIVKAGDISYQGKFIVE